MASSEYWDRIRTALDIRPVVVLLAGPNGAGKTTFYNAFLQETALLYVNADVMAKELQVPAYEAAQLTSRVAAELLRQRQSFVFETVFSDPVGAKLAFLKEAAQLGYNVIVLFIGLDSPGTSEARVAMRASQGGHDVPTDKLYSRFPRTLANLQSAIREMPLVFVFDNENLLDPFRFVALFKGGHAEFLHELTPDWLKTAL
jgi:predicted ABC-type ATPase